MVSQAPDLSRFSDDENATPRSRQQVSVDSDSSLEAPSSGPAAEGGQSAAATDQDTEALWEEQGGLDSYLAALEEPQEGALQPGEEQPPEPRSVDQTVAQHASPSSSPGSSSPPEADTEMAEADGGVDLELESSHESAPADSAGQTTAAEQDPSTVSAASGASGDSVAEHSQESAEGRSQEVLPEQQPGEGDLEAAGQNEPHLLDQLAGE